MLNKLKYLNTDEKLNVFTHGGASIFSLFAMLLLVYNAVSEENIWKILGSSVYGSSLFLLFFISAVYHSRTGKAKKLFQKFDHIAIYLLIAGTYTPYILVKFRNDRGLLILGIVWSLSALGIIFKAFAAHKFNLLSTLFYVLIAWTVLLEIKTVFQTLSNSCLVWLVGGALFYMIGVYFFLKDHRPLFHPIWHIFVVAGAFSHFLSIYLYVI
ncbi:MAG: hemolysin III family protein [Leptospiraceae bacterium]|nr:hemolysin III family protein [Leptospiraceae bacterium]MCP5499148.1 hemolysin III family protein [Leptospiraceae bacterium]